MIRLRLATEAGIQEITPASLTHCAGCEQEYYLDGPADPDPHFCCEVYDRRTDRRRLPECVRATNPVIVEEMRRRARNPAYGNTVVVPFPEERRPRIKSASVMGIWAAQFVHRTLRFHMTRCECDEHGQFTALLLHGEEPFCPSCIASWEADMRRVLYHICYCAVASLHRQRMDAERTIPAWQLLTQECWYLLGPNPSWNPQT